MIRGSTRHPVSVYTRCFISVYGIVMALGVNAEMPPEGTIREFKIGKSFIMFDGNHSNTDYAVVVTKPGYESDGELVWWSLSRNTIERERDLDDAKDNERRSPTGIFDCVGPKGEKFGAFQVTKPVNFLNVNPSTNKNSTWYFLDKILFDCAKFALKTEDGRRLAYPGPRDFPTMRPDFTWEPETPDEPDQGRGKWVGGAAFQGESWEAPDWTKNRKLTCTKRSEPVPSEPVPTGTQPPAESTQTGTPKPAIEPTGTTKPIDVTTKPIDEPTGTTEPIDEPTSESSPKSSAEQSPKPTNEPAPTTTGEPTTKPTDKPSPKPFYCRAWFFIVIAVVVAVVGAIVFVVLTKCTKCMGEEEDDDHDYSSSSSDSDEDSEKKQQEEAVELDSDSSDSSDSDEAE